MLAWWGGQCSKSSARTSHHRWQSSPWSTHKTIVLGISDQTPDMDLCCWIVFRVQLSVPIANMWGILFQLTGGGWWVVCMPDRASLATCRSVGTGPGWPPPPPVRTGFPPKHQSSVQTDRPCLNFPCRMLCVFLLQMVKLSFKSRIKKVRRHIFGVVAQSVKTG